MHLIRILKYIYKAEHPHFLSVDKETYFKWKFIIMFVVRLNKKYKSCEIFRKRYKSMENIVVIALKFSGRNVKRRTSGFAKDFVNSNRKAKCIYCSQKLTLENATTDHIVPISEGGNNSQINFIVCCKECNNERGNMEFKTYFSIKHKEKDVNKLFF